MKYRVSNRVFWAAIVLAGCVILSSRSRSQSELPDPPPPPPAKPTFIDDLHVRHLEIVDDKDRPRIIQTVDTDQRAILYFKAAKDAEQGNDSGTYDTIMLASQPRKAVKGEDQSKPCEDAYLHLSGYRAGENSAGSGVQLTAAAESHFEMLTGHRGYRAIFLQPAPDGQLLRTSPPAKWDGK